MNTLLTYQQQLDLVNRKLAVKKTDGIFDTFKYHRRVMYDYLWDKEPAVWECRGHVYDNRNGNLVQAAPRKSFNYLENHWFEDVPLNTRVDAFKKYNGYMACAIHYQGEIVVSTTGSTTSEFVQLAYSEIGNCKDRPLAFSEDYTDLFEIILEEDPHIVKEKLGAVWLGSRSKKEGSFFPTYKTCEMDNVELKDVLEAAKTYRGEGFMVHLPDGRCCKIKSDYYVGKKKLMRANDRGVDFMYDNNESVKLTFPSMFFPLIDIIVKGIPKESWKTLPEQDRRKLIEIVIGE